MTIRNIPAGLRKQLEKIAKEKDLSLNQALLECVARGASYDMTEDMPRIDISMIFGSMSKKDVKALDEAVAWSDAASLRAQAQDERERKKYDAARARHKPVQGHRRRSA